MLSMRSIPSAPPIPEKVVKVKILRAIYVNGKACELGSTATLTLSDAKLLTNSVPPTVEIL